MTISYVGAYAWGDMTSWATGGTVMTLPIASITGGPAAGDLVMVFYSGDPNYGISLPAGWTQVIAYHPSGRCFELQYKILTTGDLSASFGFTIGGESDFTIWAGCWRGADVTTPIAAWNHADNGGHSSDVAVTVPAGTGYKLVEAFCDWHSNWGGGFGAPAGATMRYYSPSIRWEANLGVYEKDDPVGAGSQSLGLGSFGTRNYRAVVALKESTLVPRWTDADSNSAMVMG